MQRIKIQGKCILNIQNRIVIMTKYHTCLIYFTSKFSFSDDEMIEVNNHTEIGPIEVKIKLLSLLSYMILSPDVFIPTLQAIIF